MDIAELFADRPKLDKYFLDNIAGKEFGLNGFKCEVIERILVRTEIGCK
jgi:hypothetical protein